MPGLSVGKRNLLQRIARSRMARDVRRAGRHLAAGWTVATIAVGSWVIIGVIVDWLTGH